MHPSIWRDIARQFGAIPPVNLEFLLQPPFAGVPAVSAAAMLHAGGTIFDALPHGSFFHATAGAVGMSVKDRLKLFPFGALVGAMTTAVSVLVYLIAR